MPDSLTIDTSELDKLAADLGSIPPRTGRFLRSAIEVTARNVRDTWRQNAMGLAHAPRFPYSITYDVGAGYGQSFSQSAASVVFGQIFSAQATTLTAEIGPDKGRTQGALGNLIEYGSVNNPPQGLGHGALQANEADFERGVSRAIDDGLKAARL